jgi:hypothetical protein
MSIYPDKKAGKLTGRFVVEVQQGKARKRGRFNTLPEAREAERRFIAEFAGRAEPLRPKQEPATPQTLLQLLRIGYALAVG